MQVKFLRTIVTNFGKFDAGTVHDLTDEQANHLVNLNPNDIELVKKSVKSDVN
ncbi:hypothetical protein [Paenibacillus sp. Soil724D2]|uniref:hypothetical protein n=1 Tax=Paenibacillus sp. (strain Soil724D2) TaxID=1736392 RepID=UPI000AD7BA2D|nr:hypothetical protein [Paenibacillus sp. Soil724D2]